MHAHLRTLVVIAIAVAVGLVPTDAQAQEVSRIVGTWVLNRAASTFGPNRGPRRLVLTYEDRGDGMVHATFRGVDARGNVTRTTYTARHDGTNYRRQVTGARGYRTIALTRVDAYSSNWVTTVDGAVTATGTSAVSTDGQTYTQTTIGAPGRSVLVFDRR